MDSVPWDCIPLRLPRGEIVSYPAGRPSIRVLIQQISALGYEALGFPLQQTDLGQLPPGVWYSAVVVGEFILFIADPTARSASDSGSLHSGYPSWSDGEPDSDNFDPDRFSGSPSWSDNEPDSDNVDPDRFSGYPSWSDNEPDSNVDPDFPEAGP